MPQVMKRLSSFGCKNGPQAKPITIKIDLSNLQEDSKMNQELKPQIQQKPYIKGSLSALLKELEKEEELKDDQSDEYDVYEDCNSEVDNHSEEEESIFGSEADPSGSILGKRTRLQASSP